MDDAVTEANASQPGSPSIPPLPDSRPTYRFTWDPSVRRAGPSSVSEATENNQRGDGALPGVVGLFRLEDNVSSLNLTLPHDWSSSKHGFNAISTVLNNPHKRAAPPKAHSFLPAVAAAELPHVRRKDFEPYLASIKSEWERFERSTRLGREGAAQLGTPDLPEPPSAVPTRHMLHYAPPGKSLPPLSVVPSVYFNSSFDLGDPATFALVTETEDADTPHDPFSLAHSLPLLEKLSHYADIVEQHLVREISLRSSSFFAALTNLQDLQAESSACLDRVGRLRGMLREVDERTAKRGLEMVRLESKLSNLERVSEGVKMVKDVGEMVGVAGGLVSAGQWGEALGVIDELEGLWDPLPNPQQTEGAIPLSSLHAFSALPSHLRELTLQIATSLSTDIVSVLITDLHDRVEGKAPAEEVLRDRMRPLLQELVRTKGVKDALEGWREGVMKELRGVVKQHVPGSEDLEEEDAAEASKKAASLAKDLREMTHDDFLRLLRQIYGSFTRCIQGVQTQSQIITELLETLSAPSDETSPLVSTLSSSCDLSNTLASKLLLYRTDAHSHLTLPAFHLLFTMTWTFVLSCEVLCRRMIVSLRGAMVLQAKAFLNVFHAAKVAELAKKVEEEVWGQVEVQPEIQQAAERLVEAAMRDPDALVMFPAEAEAETEAVQRPLSPPSTPPRPPSPPPAADPPAATKQLRIEERGYFVVGATLQVLVVLLVEYVKLIMNMPLLTMDAVGRVIEFLKAFNSRTCQVVLGAGAMRSAGLKNITAKHLALASQSLSVAIALVPYVRETFRRHLSATQAVMLVEFDRLKRDYQEHQNEIHEKLVVIMGDRLGVHCRSLQEVRWDEATPGPHGYMEMLVKETVTLHKVLAKYLAGPTVELIMSQVLAAINHRLSEEYAKIDLENQAAKDRLLVDVRFLQEKMGGLRHAGGGLGGMLETVVQEKTVRRGAVEKRKLSEKLEAVVRGDEGVQAGREDRTVSPEGEN